MNRMVMLFLLLTLLSGTTLVLVSKHWFPIWLGLELSTLSILPMLSSKTWSRGNEATLKYFLVQAFSAAMLLKGATLNLWLAGSWEMSSTKDYLVHSMISLAIIMKLGLAPCHFWFPDVLSGMSFKKGMIMACWQKMAPLVLMAKLKKFLASELFILCAVLSVLVGAWGGLNQVSTRKMLAYSSMGHMGWMTCTLFFSVEVAIILFLFYMLKKALMFCMCSSKTLSHLSTLSKMKGNPTSTLLFSLALLSLGGLPPLGGFMKKLIPISIFTIKKSLIIMPLFMMGSLMSLYFYLRVTFKTSLTLFPQKSLSLVSTRTKGTSYHSVAMSILAPLTLWGILLVPLLYLFM